MAFMAAVVSFNSESLYPARHLATPTGGVLWVDLMIRTRDKFIRLKCCGVKAFKDWEESAWFDLPDRNDLTVPDSCCIEPSDDCGKNVETNISFNGCEGTILALAWHELLIFAVLALVTFVLQMVACLISCCIKFHDPLYD
ncbi:hypothetical protein TCAL_16400 [Tigriopus californicus]|uniref:Tetraspanin n=1 Tax=Tigriopus californicus TaxID=6832 RepID=A0A553NYB4_TIGCA|nr:hypothetical protein TCAL_16400 [Tigriopus californicus]